MIKPEDFELQQVYNFQELIIFPLLKIDDNERNTF